MVVGAKDQCTVWAEPCIDTSQYYYNIIYTYPGVDDFLILDSPPSNNVLSTPFYSDGQLVSLTLTLTYHCHHLHKYTDMSNLA